MIAFWFLAMAPTGTEGGKGNPWDMVVSIIPLAAIFLIMYMLLIRPQRKREKERRQMVQSVKENDRVVTIGGIHGRIVSVEEHQVVVDCGKNVSLRIDKSAVHRVIPPGGEDKGEDRQSDSRAGRRA